MLKEREILDSDDLSKKSRRKKESSWLWRKFSTFFQRDLELHRKMFYRKILLVSLGVIGLGGGVLLHQNGDVVAKWLHIFNDEMNVWIQKKDPEYWKEFFE